MGIVSYLKTSAEYIAVTAYYAVEPSGEQGWMKRWWRKATTDIFALFVVAVALFSALCVSVVWGVLSDLSKLELVLGLCAVSLVAAATTLLTGKVLSDE